MTLNNYKVGLKVLLDKQLSDVVVYVRGISTSECLSYIEICLSKNNRHEIYTYGVHNDDRIPIDCDPNAINFVSYFIEGLLTIPEIRMPDKHIDSLNKTVEEYIDDM